MGMTAERVGESFMGSPPLSPLSSCSAVVGLSVLAQHDLAVRETAEEKREFHCLREPQVCQQQSDKHTCSRGPDISRSLLRFTALAPCTDCDRMTDCIILKKPSNHMLSSSICSSKTHLHPLNICRNIRGSSDPQHK